MPRRRRVKQNGTQCHKILLTSKPLNFPTSSFSLLCLRELRERPHRSPFSVFRFQSAAKQPSNQHGAKRRNFQFSTQHSALSIQHYPFCGLCGQVDPVDHVDTL